MGLTHPVLTLKIQRLFLSLQRFRNTYSGGTFASDFRLDDHRGRGVWLSGPHGTGKTSVIEQTAARLTGQSLPLAEPTHLRLVLFWDTSDWFLMFLVDPLQRSGSTGLYLSP